MNLRNIPFNIPSIDESEIDEVAATLRSGWITTGPRTKKFESKFAEYVGARYAIALNSCTAGLHLSLVANNIGNDNEVITTPNTFAATAEVIVNSGATPVLVDSTQDGFNIAPGRIQEAVTTKTRAIIPVHFAGEPCDMDEILHIARQNNLVVIEDAAHALGAAYKNRNIGTIGDVTAFSFYATKNLTTGEGGMVTTDDAAVADKIRLLSLHGLSRDAWKRYASEGSWYYEICEPGFKYNMSDIQAAIGLIQLQKFQRLQQKRRELVDYYCRSLGEMEEVLLPSSPSWVDHAWHLFVIRINAKTVPHDRDSVIKSLGAKGIGCSVHFIPLHLHPLYKKRYGYKLGDFPNAEKTYAASISLPLYPNLDFEDVDYIVETLCTILHKQGKRSKEYV